MKYKMITIDGMTWFVEKQGWRRFYKFIVQVLFLVLIILLIQLIYVWKATEVNVFAVNHGFVPVITK